MEARKKGGRPAITPGEASVSLRVRVSQSVADGLQKLSAERHESQGAIVRRAIDVEFEKLRPFRSPRRKARKKTMV